MTVEIPRVLFKNSIARVLDELKTNYGKITRKGDIYGLLAIDQDAKIIAIDTRFDRRLNYWDLSSIGAALYGVARQGQDFFEASDLERATIIYNNMQLFVKSIGQVNLEKKGKREILIVILADREVNIGVTILQMKRYAPKIKLEIEKSGEIKETLKMNEHKLKEYIKKMKKDLFSDKLGTLT